MDLTVSNPDPTNPGGANNSMVREYRKGNWTLQETMVLIEAKKMDDQRRLKRIGDSGERGKPAELRWKWVEDYCWKNACLRSQNQCNDKWDNLMRDFKKVREYEKRVADGRIGEDKSYWRIDKNERKHNNLPSNLLPQIYNALVDAVDRKSQWTPALLPTAAAGSSSGSLPPGVSILRQQPVMPIQMVQQYSSVPQAIPMLPPPAQTQTPPEPSVPPPCPPVDSESSEEYTDSSAKRQKREGEEGEGRNSGEEVGSAISRSARMIAEAIERSEEREERRHREVVSVQQRRLEIEESKAEINRQGIHGLVDAINNLANSVMALADRHLHKPHSK